MTGAAGVVNNNVGFRFNDIKVSFIVSAVECKVFGADSTSGRIEDKRYPQAGERENKRGRWSLMWLGRKLSLLESVEREGVRKHCSR